MPPTAVVEVDERKCLTERIEVLKSCAKEYLPGFSFSIESIARLTMVDLSFERADIAGMEKVSDFVEAYQQVVNRYEEDLRIFLGYGSLRLQRALDILNAYPELREKCEPIKEKIGEMEKMITPFDYSIVAVARLYAEIVNLMKALL